MAAVSNPPNLKTPVRPLQRGPLAMQIEKQIAQRSALFSDPLLDLKTVSTALGGASYSRLRALIKSGKLKVFRIGRGHMKVRQSVLSALLAEGDQQQGVKP